MMPGLTVRIDADLCVGAELRGGERRGDDPAAAGYSSSLASSRAARASRARVASSSARRLAASTISRASRRVAARSTGEAIGRLACALRSGGLDQRLRPPRCRVGPADPRRPGRPAASDRRRPRAHRRSARREPRRGSCRQHHPQRPFLDDVPRASAAAGVSTTTSTSSGRRAHASWTAVGSAATRTGAPANAKPSTRWRLAERRDAAHALPMRMTATISP